MTRNPHLRAAKFWFVFCTVTLVPAFLIALACADTDPGMMAYLIPPVLLFLGGMARLLWRAYRWRPNRAAGPR
jgi:hypothetical protein